MDSDRKVKHELYSAALGQNWDEVLKLFKEHPDIQATKVTTSEDTVLHVAISLGAPEDTEKVAKLIEEIEKTPKEIAVKTLAAKNNRHDTPLHYAASRGFMAICRCIIGAREASALVCERNKEGETPMFLAALNGQTQMFLYLHWVCRNMNATAKFGLLRRGNGDTVLHCAIQREYFDLALYIIHLYGNDDPRINIASSRNEEGITPLQVLASIPSAFKSSTCLIWRHKLFYNYVKVEELKIDTDQSHVLDFGNSDLSKLDAEPVSHIQTRGSLSLRKIKEKHVRGRQIMEELLERSCEYEYNDEFGDDFKDQMQEIMEAMKNIQDEQNKKGKPSNQIKKSTALLVAIKYGVTELVIRILEKLPVAICDTTEPKKRNIVHMAVQKRQTRVLKLLMDRPLWKSLTEAVDADGNNVLHMAAFLPKHMPWEVHGSAMQMQYEAKWFKYVKQHVPPYLLSQERKDGDTPDDIFAGHHKELLKESSEWVKDVSESYSIVAALTAGVTYATSYTVPGDTDDTGKPKLEGQFALNMFVVSVLVSFCFSVTSLAAFLAVFSSRKQPKDFLRSLPLKMCLGMTSFYVSIISMLVSFCAAHSLEVDHRIMHKVSPWYGLVLIPLCFYTAAQLPLYWDLVKASLTKVPQPKYVGKM